MVKILSRNIMEEGSKDFLVTYKNLRAYQKVFRKLVRTGGEIKIVGNKMIVKLDCFGRKKFKAVMNKYFEKINNRQIKFMNNWYTLEFENFF